MQGMTTIDRLEGLFRALADGDHQRALSLAAEIAAAEDRKRHLTAARRLRTALSAASDSSATHRSSPVIAAQTIVPQSLLVPEPAGPLLSDVFLRTDSRQTLEELIFEHQHSHELSLKGLNPRRRILLTGPPGTGKTITARAIARTIGLPIFSARLSSVIGSYLGETASNLRVLFQFASTTACILLLDEFDAIGRQRGRQDDIGEIDRVLVSMLQELDHQEPRGMIIAATNLSGSLDPALVRRFDINLTMPIPTLPERTRFATTLLQSYKINTKGLSAEIAKKATTYADTEQLVTARYRAAILQDIGVRHGKIQ